MRAFLFMPVIFSLLINCSHENKVLAEMNGHLITKGELRQWLALKGDFPDQELKSGAAVIRLLEELAVEKLTAEKAKSVNFHEDPAFIRVNDAIFRNYTVSYLQKAMRQELKFHESAADISIIRLKFCDEIRGNLIDAAAILEKEVIPLLVAGVPFEDAARKYSDDPSGVMGGRIGFVTGYMAGDELTRVISGLRPGEFSREPVICRDSCLLVKVNKRTEINERNMRRRILDKNNREEILDYLLLRELNRLEADALDRFKIAINLVNPDFSDPEVILFEIEDRPFTVEDFNSILLVYNELKYGPFFEIIENRDEKIAAVYGIFRENLFYHIAESMKITEYRDFVENWNLLSRSSLSGAYKYRKLSAAAYPADAEIYSEYLNKRNSDYLIELPDGRKVYQPYSRVKTLVGKKIYRERLRFLKMEWGRSILDENNFRVALDTFQLNKYF